MPTITTIDPVTRLEGHLKVEVKIDTVNSVPQVVDVKSTGTLFRGFENILQNRDPGDAPHITERICGVCPVSHGMSAVLAQEAAAKATIPDNGRIMRNMVLASNYIQSHILHFYHLALQDFVDGPDMPPWQPSWKADKRLDAATNTRFVNNYVKALEMRRKAHEMAAVFGGRMPHPPTPVPGGITATLTAARIAKMRAYLAELIPFIQNTYIPDVDLLTSLYPDYDQIGRGYGNLLAYGVFDLNATGSVKLLRRGRVSNGGKTVMAVDVNEITEHVTYSWYADGTNSKNPAAGVTTPQYPKGKAYSWLKAPRYKAGPHETGPLARMWINGDYRRGISVNDRHRARALEALKVAKALLTWCDQLILGRPSYAAIVLPTNATGVGLTEAPRGAIGHWLQVAGGKISRYQIITPTCWNCSPRDSASKMGPMEKALIGTPVKNIEEPVEVVRVIHSFDPCLSCAVHVMRPAEGAKIFALGHFHGEEEGHAHEHGEGHAHTHAAHDHADGGHGHGA